MYNHIKKIIFIIFISLWLLLNSAFADVIKNYDVVITVLKSGKIDVVETIEMDIDHQDVRLGIIRNIPKTYAFRHKTVKTPIKVWSVTRNGLPENYWVEQKNNEYEIYTGAKGNHPDNYLPLGKNIYQFNWQSSNHIRSFEDYDELYFNAIGHDWAFPIETASVTVIFPEAVTVKQYVGYYGSVRSTRTVMTEQISPQTVVFTVPESIGLNRGMTVAVGVTQGVLPSVKPSIIDRMLDTLIKYVPFVTYMHIIVVICFSVMFLYWCICYLIYRLQLPYSQRAFTVRFSPPNLSLDQISVLSHGSNDRLKTVLLIDLVRRQLIQFNDDKKTIAHHPSKNKNTSGLTEGQEVFLEDMSEQYQQQLYYSSYNESLDIALRRLIRPAISYKKQYYKTSLFQFFMPFVGVLLLVVLIGWALSFLGEIFIAYLIATVIGSAIIFGMLYSLPYSTSLWNFIWRFILFLFIGGIGLGCVLFPFWGFGKDPINDVWSGVLMAIIFQPFYASLFLYNKIKPIAHTQYLDLEQQVLEFKHYLQYIKAEEYHLIPPEVFEEYLPYSIIFGVDHHWLKRYQEAYPDQYKMAENSSVMFSYGISQSYAFKHAQSAPKESGGYSMSTSWDDSSSSFSSGSGSGSGGGGFSGGGSGGGGGRGR